MRKLMLALFCATLSFTGVAQNSRLLEGLVMNEKEQPMGGVVIKPEDSDASTVSAANGTFKLDVAPFAKYIYASFEGYKTVKIEIDGSYIVIKLKVDEALIKAKIKAAEAERLAAEKAEKARAKAAEAKRRTAEREARAKAKAERAKKRRAMYSEHRSGYGSIVDLSITNDFISESSYSVSINYIGGYRFNNNIFLGLGSGIRIPFGFLTVIRPVVGEQLYLMGPSFPVFAYFKANFLNRRWSPFVALSAGARFHYTQEMRFDLCHAEFNHIGTFINPQIGVNFRMTKNVGTYLTVGYNAYTGMECISKTGYNATIKPAVFGEFDIHLGVTF